MIVDKLVSDGQPINWYDTVTRECKGYPVHLVDIGEDELVRAPAIWRGVFPAM